MKFNIRAKDKLSRARSAVLQFGNEEVKTPIFMPVGTLGSVKGLHQRELKEEVNAKIILGNSYHLYLRPGLNTIKNAGGLHKFIGWDRFMLTDSGGYQVYSLAKNRKIDNEGVKFQSHIDGSSHFITPEFAIDIQRTIGADIIMAFDECTPYPCEKSYAKNSLDLTNSWLDRCIKRFGETNDHYLNKQNLFPIVQGSIYEDLRIESARYVNDKNCSGNAIGGLSVGEPAEVMYEMTEVVCSILNEDKPRYLMGVGTPVNILESIARGIDMFDCVLPTRNARHGILYTKEGIINIKNEKWKDDNDPINDTPMSFIDNFYSKSYLRHLLMNNELLAAQIGSINNLVFYKWLMEEARSHIESGDYSDWKDGMIDILSRRL